MSNGRKPFIRPTVTEIKDTETIEEAIDRYRK